MSSSTKSSGAICTTSSRHQKSYRQLMLKSLIRRRLPVINPIEQEFERAMWLGAPQNLRTEQHDPSLPERRLDDLHRLIEVVLSPGPTAFERRRRANPRDGLDALQGRVRQQAERLT